MSASVLKAEGRVYGGRSTAERDAQRREAMLEAALELFGTKGYGPTSMTEVADLADVPFRYVGRLFADKPALLEAVFCRTQDEILAAVALSQTEAPPDLAARIRAGLRAAITTYAQDERRVRIDCLEVVGVSPRLEERRRGMSRRFVDQLVSGLDSAAEAGAKLPPGYALLGVGLVGAVEALLTDWALGRATLGDVIEAACTIYLRTLRLPETS